MNFRHAVLTAAAALGAAHASAASDVVVIDHGEPAYTVYAGVPAEQAEDLKRKLEGKAVDLVPFAEFAGNPGTYVGVRMIRNDYPDGRTEEGIVALVGKYPGTPFGVTWNGGIAFTRNDYAAARKSFAAFKTTGEHRVPSPELDPVVPGHHLRPLLGW